MGVIAAKINSIIAERKKNLEILKKTQENVDSAKSNVSSFKVFQNEIKENPEKFHMFKGDLDIIERIAEIPTDDFMDAYAEYSCALERLIKRLSRDSLNISFIGRAGQGKSLIMQNISGLDNSVIPSAKGSDCTGAKSIITNSDQDDTEAEITFYSRDEIKSTINTYIEKITGGNGRRISDISDIPSIPVDKLQDEAENRTGTTDGITEMCNNLREYVEHYSEYKDYIGASDMKVSKNEIEKFVAHYSCSDSSQRFYRYLAVKIANIKTRFPHEDVGKIVLVDTIGIGKTAIGVEDEMLDAVENDSDAIILILRPDPMRYSMDKELEILAKIQERVSKAYTKEMLFWVLNRVDKGESSNAAAVIELIQKIQKRGYAIAKPLNVNCFLKDDVESHFLIPVLEHISGRIANVDKLLIDKLNESGEKLFKLFSDICVATNRVLASSANEDLKRKFYKKINPTIKQRILNNLRNLYLDEYNELRQAPCEELMEAAADKLKNILCSIPSNDEIIELLSYGDANQTNVYEACTNIMRMKIIDDFIKLDIVLEKLVEKMKKQVIHILADESNGRLSFIYPFNSDTSTWIEGFINVVEGEKKYPFLTEALRKFQAYTINVQGFLIHEVREQLDPIDISIPNTAVPQIAGNLNQPDVIAEDIYELLRTYAEEIKDNVDMALRNLYVTPNRSMFAAIKDLYDRITYTMADNESKVAEEWRYLYEDWIPVIWKEEYQQESALQTVAEKWNSVVGALKELNSFEHFIVKI